MTRNRQHAAFLQFISRITDITASLSKDELREYCTLAEEGYPALARVIREYLRVAERSDTSVSSVIPTQAPRSRNISYDNGESRHLFDLLRSKRFFPSNKDLADFAARVLPDMTRNRFEKMSRGDIAARIVEYVETKGPSTKRHLQQAMSVVLDARSKPSDRESFLSTWEAIIKGT